MAKTRKKSFTRSRSAEYTIKGFLYQFNKTAIEILKAHDDAHVSIEGVIEDIEVETPTTMTGIQCKYHGAATAFAPSHIYEPLLKMLNHFSSHPKSEIKYVIFAHFPGAEQDRPTVGMDELNAALLSKDASLTRIIQNIPSGIDRDSFISKFRMEFGPSYEDLVEQVSELLEANGFPKDEIETLAYPNTIHIVSQISIQPDPADRQVTRRQFLERLNGIRTTAISRWTLALQTRKKLLESRHKQLKTHLGQNSRLRYFVIDPKSFSDFNAEIVLFINEYVDKYHFKYAHISTPVFCICTSREEVQRIQERLYSKEIITEDGYVGAQFVESRFFRDPFVVKGTGGIVKRDFQLRLADREHLAVLNIKKGDDLFVLGDPDWASLDTVDVNVEHLAGVTIKEIKYLIGISNVWE